MLKARIVIRIHGETYRTKAVANDDPIISGCESAKEMLTLWLYGQNFDKLQFELVNGETLIMTSNVISQAIFLIEEVSE